MRHGPDETLLTNATSTEDGFGGAPAWGGSAVTSGGAIGSSG
jgi:hypothetical protein